MDNYFCTWSICFLLRLYLNQKKKGSLDVIFTSKEVTS